MSNLKTPASEAPAAKPEMVPALRELREVLDTLGRGQNEPKPKLRDIPSWIPQHQSTKRVSFADLSPLQKEAIKTSILTLPSPPTHAPEKQRKERDAAYYTKPFCKFLTDNPTIFHVVDAFAADLKAHGYKKISERDAWKIEKGGKYFVERNGSSMIAFSVGDNYEPGNGAAMVAGHVDVLTAKLKPIPKLRTKAGYVQLGVAPYAGALNSTWWDRDLGIGGRVLVKDSSGKIVTKLAKLDWPSKSF
jgi:hypothetical protein